MSHTVTLIGVDCATQPQRTGLALGQLESGTPHLLQTMMGGETAVPQQIASWIEQSSHPVLLGLDAPLGWPADMGMLLATHEAGRPLTVPPNALFRRETDRFIRDKLGKQSLDVGADRIARTAHAALALLAEVRELTGLPIPLAWPDNEETAVRVIETYPAATLTALGIRVRGYRKGNGRSERQQLLDQLKLHLEMACDTETMLAQVDALDAALCVLGTADLLNGRCYPPADLPLAKKEGWMWVRKKEEATDYLFRTKRKNQ